MVTKNVVKAALSAMVALGLGLAATEGVAAGKSHEKCYGVAKKGMNDCGTKMHSCSGQSKKDGDATEWLYLPKGTCGKVVGGSLAPSDDS